MREQNAVLFSIADAAKSLGGISHWTLRKHIASGRLLVVRIGRRVFLDTEEIERIRREGLPSLQVQARTKFPEKAKTNLSEETQESCLTQQP